MEVATGICVRVPRDPDLGPRTETSNLLALTISSAGLHSPASSAPQLSLVDTVDLYVVSLIHSSALKMMTYSNTFFLVPLMPKASALMSKFPLDPILKEIFTDSHSPV